MDILIKRKCETYFMSCESYHCGDWVFEFVVKFWTSGSKNADIDWVMRVV